MITLLILLVIGALVFVARSYNRLQQLSQNVRMERGNIAASMHKRINLANKLQDIALAHAEHENFTHLAVTGTDSTISALTNSALAVERAVSQVTTLARNYPDLHANQTYQQLMFQMDDLETNLEARHQAYNEAVRKYNTERSRIPIVFFASAIGYNAAPYFNVEYSNEPIKEFATEDGEKIKELISGAGRKLLDKSKQLGRELEDKKKKISSGRSKVENSQTPTQE